MKKNAWIAAAIVCADQLLKSVIRRCPLGFSYGFLPGFMRITHCTNSGAAFNLLSGQTVLLVICSLLLMAGILVFVCRIMNLTDAAQKAIAALIGGGISNLLDRICFGGVTDYLELLLFEFPVFNTADIAITLSIALLLIMALTGRLEITSGEEHG